MKTKLNQFHARVFCAVALGIGASFSLAAPAAGNPVTLSLSPGGDEGVLRMGEGALPMSGLGAKAGADCQGDGLAITPTADGARLRCAFQRLEGEATREGLWLRSTVDGNPGDKFRMSATAMGRLVAQPSRLRVKGASSPRAASGD